MLGEEPMPDLSEEDSEGEEEEEEEDDEDGDGDDAGDGALPMYSDEGSSEGEEGDDDEDDNEEVGCRPMSFRCLINQTPACLQLFELLRGCEVRSEVDARTKSLVLCCSLS